MEQIQTLIDQALSETLNADPGRRLMLLENAFLLLDPSLKTSPWVPNTSRLLGAGDMLHLYPPWRLARAQCLFDLGALEEAYSVTQYALCSSVRYCEILMEDGIQLY
jgi:hypothetical protein